MSEIERLRTEVQRLKWALSEFADRGNWRRSPDSADYEWYGDADKPWKFAQEALAASDAADQKEQPR